MNKHFNTYKIFFLVFVLGIISLTSFAQVGPQGQNGKSVLWGYVQLDQKLTPKWTSSTILCYSRRNSFTDRDFVESARYFGLWCFRQEFARPFAKNFRFSIGSFYSLSGINSQSNTPSYYIDEFRLYPRVFYDLHFNKKRLTFQFRNDFRFMFTSGLREEQWTFAIRQRLGIQSYLPLDKKEQVVFLPMVELFGAVSHAKINSFPPQWSNYRLTDLRLLAYLRFKLNEKLFLDVGHMTQLRFPIDFDNERTWSGYWALGLLIRNPFGEMICQPVEAK